MSSNPSPGPFDNLSQPAGIPSELSPRITVRDINTAEPGPYYVYIPGIDAEGLQSMLHSPEYSRIPAGEVFRIGAIEESMLAGRLDAAVPHKEVTISHPIEQRVIDKLHVIAIPAGTTLNALKSDRAVTQHVLAHIVAFDKLDVEYRALNELIRPVAIRELDKPAEWRKEIDAVGMLALRLRWLQEAAERLETGRMLEAHRRIIDERPFLRDLWRKAVSDVLIPSIDQFRIVAETKLAAIEDRMRNPQNSDNYDRYSFKLMWLLGRQPERTALSRTLEASGRGAAGGLTPEEIRAFVAAEVAKQGGTSQAAMPAPAKETMQCPDCGEDIRTVNGGPPRICRHCRYEFRPKDDLESNEATSTPQPVDVIWPVSDGTQAAAELDGAMPLAAQGEETEPKPAGEGLSDEDEAEIKRMAADILRGS